MKRIVLSLLLCSVALLSLAQKKLYYCEVKGIEKELTSGLKIVFDFGEKASYNMWGDLSSKLKFVDEDGAEIKFNSMVDAANYMVDRVAKTEHSHPLGMVVSTHFRCGKGVKRGLKNGALPFNID